MTFSALRSRPEWYRFKHWAGKSPALVPLIGAVSGWRQCQVSKDTKVCIEGFPRSANTFAVAAFRSAQTTNMHIARHSHMPGQIIRAVREQIPTVVLIREPVGATVSFKIHSPFLGLDDILLSYISFYESLAPWRDYVLVATFDQVVQDFGNVTRKLNERFASNFGVFQHTDENVAVCFAETEEMGKAFYSSRSVEESHVARPSKARSRMKAIYEQQLLDSKFTTLLDRALKNYVQFKGNQVPPPPPPNPNHLLPQRAPNGKPASAVSARNSPCSMAGQEYAEVP